MVRKEELENLVHGFQQSEEEAKEPNRKTKNLSHAAWEERVKQQVRADVLSRALLPQLSIANLSGEQIFRVELEAMALNNSGSLQGYSGKLAGTDI